MFTFIKRLKREQAAKRLEASILKALEPYLPELIKTHELISLVHSTVLEQDEKVIQLQHSTFHQVFKPVHYEISGVSILHKKTNHYINLKLKVYSSALQFIYLPFEKDLDEFDIRSIKVIDLQTQQLTIDNPDEITVRKILSRLTEEQKNQLDIPNTFEIQLDGKQYYTILDMQDANYIAIDKKGIVYRLIHDHDEPVREIAATTEAFLQGFDGKIQSLQPYFD
ncbi:MAG TPA: hypothetical protein VF602_12300 [Pedobacter sp.]|jgi:hypothetical protein